MRVEVLRTIQIDSSVLRPKTKCKVDAPLAKKLEKLGYVKVLEKPKKQAKDKKEDVKPKKATKKKSTKKETPKKKAKE